MTQAGAAEAIPWAEQSGLEFLPIDLPHLLALEQLPLHHRDPFARLLVAQAMVGPSLSAAWQRSLCDYNVITS